MAKEIRKKVREYTAVYRKGKRFYAAWLEEVPGVNTQGKTKREAEENLREALDLILRTNREITQELQKQESTELERKPFKISIPV